MGKQKDRSLASQEIRALVDERRIVPPQIDPETLEDKIQPSSYEPSVSDTVYVLDTDVRGTFRPNGKETIYQQMKSLLPHEARAVDITDGYELKTGHSYLIPLEETFIFRPYEHIRSSPKSSMGRIFLNSRMLTDYNMSFDEFKNTDAEQQVKLWLLVQPQAFNVVVHPGNTMNQIRYFDGLDARLTNGQLLKRYQKEPMLYVEDYAGEILPVANPIITDGLQIHLDLKGGVDTNYVGLRARKNPKPIDLNVKGEYTIDDFFTPIEPTEELKIEHGQYYLFGTKEMLKIPKNLNCELQSYSDLGFSGPLDFAGFIDNNFYGTLVLEARSDEEAPVLLMDGMPLSHLELFRTKTPDKLYGGNSNYQGQRGVRASKHFNAA